MELIKTLALLHEATVHISRKHNQMCHLLVSDAGGPEGPWSLYIYERWCPLILTIQVADNQLILAALPAMAEKHALHASCLSQLQFSLTKHLALSLEGVYASMM